MVRVPVRLGADPDRLGDPVDVVEVGDHLDGVVDRRVREPVGAQPVDLSLSDGGRLERQVDREVAERPQARVEAGLPVVVRSVFRELVVCALCTEVVGMRPRSVVALVRRGDDHGEELPFGPGQLAGAEHDRLVELHRLAQNRRAEAHRLDDVEDLAGPLDRRVVLDAQLAGRLVHVDQPQVGHGQRLCPTTV